MKAALRRPMMIVGMVIVAVVILAGVLAPVISPYSPSKLNTSDRLKPPSAEHLFGTDNLGRDILTRVLYGARISVAIGLIITITSALLGTALGALAAYYGHFPEQLIMRSVDVLIAFPVIVLAIVLSAALGGGLLAAVIAMVVVFTPRYARLGHAQVLSLKNSSFVESARAIGVGNGRILFNHIMRNALDPIIVQATLDIGFATIYTAALGFIGLGAQPPTPEWGSMISTSRDYMTLAWWFVTFPGLAIILSVLGWNLLGDGMSDIMNPRERTEKS
ncbi:MAG: ABC transporter permease [Candidatus Bipolaricaulota bacterium]|nr:ABC transporter permease [Candidatus Bipolaricaulota bacterium]